MTKPILIFGGIFGILSTVITVLMMHGAIGTFTSMFISIALLIIVLILGVRAYRSANGGYSSFKDVFSVSLGISILGLIVGIVLGQGYNMTLSEDDKSEMKAKIVESQTSVFEMIGQEVPLELEEQLEESAEAMFDIKTTLIAIPFSLIMYAFISVIVGLIMKKEEPLELT